MFVKKLICDGVWRYQPATLRKKTLSHIFLHSFYLPFLRIHHDHFFRRGFERVRAQFLSGNVNGKYCYLYFTCLITIHSSQLSSCWIWQLTFSWVQFLSNKLEFFVTCNNIKTASRGVAKIYIDSFKYRAKFWRWRRCYDDDVIIIILGKNMKNFKYCAVLLKFQSKYIYTLNSTLYAPIARAAIKPLLLGAW